MNVFDNIALNNPQPALRLLDYHGINVNPNDPDQISEGLALVAQQSDDHLKDVMNMHPDKEIIVHYFSNNPTFSNPSGIDNAALRLQLMKEAVGADGQVSTMMPAVPAPAPAIEHVKPVQAVTTTDLIMVMASLLIAFAIMSSNKNSSK